MDNREAVEAFTLFMRTKREASPGTVEKYHRLCLSFADSVASLDDATVDDVEAWLARPRRGAADGPAAATIANELATLGSFYRWGTARLGWGGNPAALAGRPKVRNRQPRPIEDSDWLAIWSQELPADARVALGLGYFCGLRREEIVNLRANQVWGGALVNFTRKGGGEDRFDFTDILAHWGVFMPQLQPQLLAEPLSQLAKRGDRRLLPWGTGVRANTLNKRMSRWFVQCGLPSGLFTPHQLRHSFATNLLRSGVPLDVASDLCNHSSVVVTMRYVKTSGGRLASLRTREAVQ